MRLFGHPISFLWVLLALIISGTLFSFSFFTNNYDAQNDVLLLKFENQRTQAMLQEEINRLKTREADLETVLDQITTKLKAGEELVFSDLEEVDSKNEEERDFEEENDDEDDDDLDDGEEPSTRAQDFSLNVLKSLNLKWAGFNPEERRKIEVAKGIKPKVLIMSLPRSGSSFIGEIFNQNPEFVYIFEPTFPTMGNAIWECQVSDPRMSTVATEVLKCEFSRFFAALARHTKKKHYIYRDFSTPMPVLKNYTNGCEDSMVAIKEVRRWGPNLKDLYSVFGSDLKIIWLLRDPRGWVSSFLYKNANNTASTEEGYIQVERNPLPPFQMRGNNRYGPKGPSSNYIPPPAPSIPRNSPSPSSRPNTQQNAINPRGAPVFERLVRESLSQLGYVFEDEIKPTDENQPLDEQQETNEEINEETNDELNQEINEERDQETEPERIIYPRDLRPISAKSNILQRRPGPGGQMIPVSIYTGTFYKVWGLERRNFFRSYYDCRNVKFTPYIIDAIAKRRGVLENQRMAAHLRMATVWLLETMINMHYVSQLPSDNVMFVRYEDFSLYPLEVTQQIYNFIGLPVVHSNVIEWIVNQNHTQSSADRDRYGHDRNSKKMVEVWKDRLGIDILREIEGICGNLMENFGYKRYNEN